MKSIRSVRGRLWVGAAWVIGLGACNGVLGIDEATYEPGQAASAGQGGASGSGGGGSGGATMGAGGAGSGTGGGPGTGGSGGSSGGGLDPAFGKNGIATTALDGKAAKAFQVRALKALPLGGLLVVGRYSYLVAEAFDRGDAFAIRFRPDGSSVDNSVPSTFGGQEGFFDGNGYFYIDREASTDDVIATYADEQSGDLVLRSSHANDETGLKSTNLWGLNFKPNGSTLAPYGTGGEAAQLGTLIYPTVIDPRLYRALTPEGDGSSLLITDVKPGLPEASSSLALSTPLSLPLVAAAAGGTIYMLAVSDDKIGLIRLLDEGGPILVDASFGGGTGFVGVTPSMLGLSVRPTPLAIAIDGSGNAIAAVISQEAGKLMSFVIKTTPSGAPDPAFGLGGILATPPGQAIVATCMALDNAGHVYLAAQQGSETRLRYFSDLGEPHPAFGLDGIVLPFEPQNCTADADRNFLFAGSVEGTDGQALLAIGRVRNPG
jgi:hypothetical protein